jgi:FixJ family two-component response regulator
VRWCRSAKRLRVAEVSVISIIDDDASVRTATTRLLRSMGFSVYAFASAQEFLSSPQLSETSCVIADVQMPGMSGVELQEYLIAQHHGMPIFSLLPSRMSAFASEP